MAKVGARIIGVLIIVLIVYNFHITETTYIDETPSIKHEYESVSENATHVKTAVQHHANYSTARDEGSTVTYNNTKNNHNLDLSANRTDMSEPNTGQNMTNDSNKLKTKTTNPHNRQLNVGLSGKSEDTTFYPEDVIDTIDVPENQTFDVWNKQNLTVDKTTDHHNYYNSTMYMDREEARKIWNEIKNITPSMMLSQSHRRAMTVQLSFDFPFYGHPVRNVTVATGGFIYTGDYVHSWLAATQYIAPLMANFDTSLSNESFVRLNDTGSSFTVLWENVYLQDRRDVGKFTFTVTLHKNGDIVFTYFSVPISMNAIQDDKHPVKVGLSDAYIIDKVIHFARRKTIYEYHRVNFADAPIINSTIIHLKALFTCLQYTDCVACISHNTTFDCTWCPVVNRCSTGTDRKKQDWVTKGCDRSQITVASSCPALGERGNNAITNPVADHSTVTASPNISSNLANKDGKNDHMITMKPYTLNVSSATMASPDTSNFLPISKVAKVNMEDSGNTKSVTLTLGVFIPLAVIACLILWVLYAYRNPHTKSGQLLIQYRPSQWSWRRGEARYTAATIHM